MSELITWLRAQLDDDERVARAAPGPEWVIGVERAGEPGHWRGVKADLVMLPPDGPFPMDLDVGDEVLRAGFINDGKFAGRWAVEHAARWDPARVLAEVEAKRRILAYDGPVCTCSGYDSPPMDPATNWTTPLPHHFDCASYETAKLLALPYADRPGYREEWAPTR